MPLLPDPLPAMVLGVVRWRDVCLYMSLRGGLLALDNGVLFILFLTVALSNLQVKDHDLYIFAFPASST